MTAVIAVIPARYGSTRLPAKPLADKTGRPLIAHVIEQVRSAQSIDQVIVATDDQRIADVVRSTGARAILTRADHPNGTSRIAEVATDFQPGTIIVNVQGDEPEIDPAHIDTAVKTLTDEVDVATLARSLAADEDPGDPNLVKVVLDQSNRALYFSRWPIPFCRDAQDANAPSLCHVGLYVYRRETVMEFADCPMSPLEKAESLEQLRFLENGRSIAVAIVAAHAPGIDTPDQYADFVQRFKTRP